MSRLAAPYRDPVLQNCPKCGGRPEPRYRPFSSCRWQYVCRHQHAASLWGDREGAAASWNLLTRATPIAR